MEQAEQAEQVAPESPDPGGCPGCGAPWPAAADQDGMLTCPSGHRAYAGYVNEAGYLTARLGWLGDRIGAGDRAPDAETARRYLVWSVTGGPGATAASGPGTGAPEPAAPSAAPGVQVLLLTVGAWLLIVAATVFAAVVWDRMGAAGQVGAMVAATVAFAVAAARLVRRVPNTAQALGLVAFGLAVVDIFAASTLGLLPKSWLGTDYPYPYPVSAVLVLAGGAVLLGHRLGIHAWVWLGWPAAATGVFLASILLARGVAGDAQPWAALTVSVVSLTGVAMLAGPYLSNRLSPDRGPMTVAGALAFLLAFGAWVDHGSQLDRRTLLGTLVTALVTATAAGAVYRRTRQGLAGYGAVLLAGVSGGVALLMVQVGGQPYWLAVSAAAAGLGLLAAVSRAGQVWAGLLSSAVLWATFALGALAMGHAGVIGDQVVGQICLLLALAAVIWFAVAGLAATAGRVPGMAWPAAVAGAIALLLSPIHLPNLLESGTLPFAALLLLAGWLWRGAYPVDSRLWLGPAVAMALLPSALACWTAPWVIPVADHGRTEAVVRTVVVLVAGVTAVWVGVRLGLAGLVVPGSLALAIAGTAQLWGVLAALPRWVALGLAGATLVTLGARIEWLSQQHRTLRGFATSLH